MGKEILTLADIDIEKKKKSYHHKSSLFLKDLEKVLVSNKICSAEKKL